MKFLTNFNEMSIEICSKDLDIVRIVTSENDTVRI